MNECVFFVHCEIIMSCCTTSLSQRMICNFQHGQNPKQSRCTSHYWSPGDLHLHSVCTAVNTFLNKCQYGWHKALAVSLPVLRRVLWRQSQRTLVLFRTKIISRLIDYSVNRKLNRRGVSSFKVQWLKVSRDYLLLSSLLLGHSFLCPLSSKVSFLCC